MTKKITLLALSLYLSTANASNIWVSDEIEAPLRSSPELNSDTVTLLPAGKKVDIIEIKGDYTKIKSGDYIGWLSNYYILKEKSVHDKYMPATKELAKVKSELSKLKAELDSNKKEFNKLSSKIDDFKSTATNAEKTEKNNKTMQDKISEQNKKITKLALALKLSKESATDAKTKYLSLMKVSGNAVDIDKQNKMLQERSVQFEQDIQLLKNENQTLKSKIGNKERLIGAGMVFAGILVGYVLTILTAPRRRSSYSSI